jgi:DNA-binding NarL/FixJ family response regulator
MLHVRPNDRALIDSLLEEGASECFSVETPHDDLRAAVRRTACHGGPASPSSLRRAREGIDPDLLADLTVREREVLQLVAEGRSRSVMAVTLHIADGTVDSHVKSIYKKLGVNSRAQLRGLVLPPL